MNNSQVAHLWANKSRQSARGSNFYFDGPALYSYGGHFCVARHVKNKRGESAVLFNADSYSNSTSRHQSYARRAVAHGVPTFTVPGCSERHQDNRMRFKDRAAAAMARIPSRRNADGIESDMRDAAGAIADYNSYSAFFALRGRLNTPRLSPADAERAQRYRANAEKRERDADARYERERPAREAAEKARLQEQAERDATMRDEFRTGSARRNWIGGPCMLRLQNGEFQTSQGASVPFADGVAMLEHVANTLGAHARGDYSLPVTYGENAPMAGGFKLREINAEEVIVGCHHIPVSECAAMAALPIVGIAWPS